MSWSQNTLQAALYRDAMYHIHEMVGNTLASVSEILSQLQNFTEAEVKWLHEQYHFVIGEHAEHFSASEQPLVTEESLREIIHAAIQDFIVRYEKCI